VTANYGQRFGAARLTVRGGVEAWARVWAAPFLLETVFANLWMNAVQAAGTGCELVIEITATGRSLEILVIDSGPGFDEAARSAVFQSQYSTKGSGGGRGLLEISEAVGRLQGKVRLVPAGPDSYRIEIVLPLEGS
jgi:two-component system sensor histidine kinase FlrB